MEYQYRFLLKMKGQSEINNDIKLDVYKIQKDLAQMSRECDTVKADLREIRIEVEKLKDEIVEIKAEIKPFSKFIYAIIGILATGLGGAILTFILAGNLVK